MTFLRPTIVLFDMDGTVVRHIHPGLLHVLERIDDVLYRLSDRKAPPDFRRPPPSAKFRPKILVQRVLHKVRPRSVKQMVEPHLGVIDVLEKMQRMNIVMALVSNGLGKGYGHDILDTFGLARFFAAQIFREDFTHSKPSPEPLLKALQALDIVPTQEDVIWCVGDRRKDVLAAQALQDLVPCPVQIFSYGMQASVAILENMTSPAHILTSYRDLEIILQRLEMEP